MRGPASALLALIACLPALPATSSGGSCLPRLEAVLRGEPSPPPAAFGQAVAAHDDRAVVGAPLQTQGGMWAAGAVHVFVRTASGYVLEAVLTAEDAQPQDQFGTSVSASGDRIAIGTAPNGMVSTHGGGVAYVFVRRAGGWRQEARIDPPATGANESFGRHVALHGDTLVVTAGAATVSGVPYAGAAYAYARSGSAWILQQRLTAPDPQAFEQMSLHADPALDGELLALGSPGRDLGGMADAGAVHVFERRGSWTHVRTLVAASPAPGESLGLAVSLSGDTLAAGAFTGGLRPDDNAGSVRVFSRAAGWTEDAMLRPANLARAERFGIAVALDGERLLVGHERDSEPGPRRAGSAALFAKQAGAWIPIATLVDESPAESEMFGRSVALDDGTIAVGNHLSLVSGAQGPGTALVFACGDGCPDGDGDGVCDDVDNCPDHANPGQEDTDGDGIGDACEESPSLRVRTPVRLECSEPLPPADGSDIEVNDPCGGGVRLRLERETRSQAGCVETITRFWLATDACGRDARATQVIEVVDSTPPEIVANPGDDRALWPPDHRMVFFRRSDFAPLVADACGDATWRFSGCVSNQPDDARRERPGGDGAFPGDCLVAGDGSFVAVRAERAGQGRGDREYRILIEATDACGNASAAPIATIRVPHDARPSPAPRAARGAAAAIRRGPGS